MGEQPLRIHPGAQPQGRVCRDPDGRGHPLGTEKFHGLDLEAAEDIPIRDFAHKRDYKAVTVTTSMDQLIEAAMNQNFVPVVDDRGMFIGIVRRQAIIRYCYDRSRAAATEQRRKPEKQEKRVPVSAGVQ